MMPHYDKGDPTLPINPKPTAPSAADRAVGAFGWIIAILIGSIFVGLLLWAAVSIWKEIPW
jgi:hypothetical protein